MLLLNINYSNLIPRNPAFFAKLEFKPGQEIRHQKLLRKSKFEGTLVTAEAENKNKNEGLRKSTKSNYIC
jgi:hypothetical protein